MRRTIQNVEELRAYLAGPSRGLTLLLEPGKYDLGTGVPVLTVGDCDALTIRAADPSHRPVVIGRSLNFHRCDKLRLLDLYLLDLEHNGINICPGTGGALRKGFWRPVQSVRIERCDFENCGTLSPNFDALKLTWIDNVLVRECRFITGSIEQGSSIDSVSCHNLRIRDCVFGPGKPGNRADNCLQLKGGTRKVRVSGCLFDHAAERLVHVGGLSSEDVFRPGDGPVECVDVLIDGNSFVGGDVAVSLAGCKDVKIRRNKIREFRDRHWLRLSPFPGQRIENIRWHDNTTSF